MRLLKSTTKSLCRRAEGPDGMAMAAALIEIEQIAWRWALGGKKPPRTLREMAERAGPRSPLVRAIERGRAQGRALRRMEPPL